jgi:hypothetical protein
MAMNGGDIAFRSVACVAATPISVAGFKASANVAVQMLEAKVSFDGATSSNAPASGDGGNP